MRIATVIVCSLIVGGCSRLGGGAALPAASSGSNSAASHSRAYGYITLYSFKGQANGGQPVAGLTYLKGTLYGATSGYGAGYGTVFSVSPLGKMHILYEFQGYPDGAYPQAGLIALNGTLYGTTSAGGLHGNGTVFEVTATGSEHIVYSFKKSGDGAQPLSPLIALNGELYGTTLNGGKRGRGAVFEVSPSGVEHVLHSFLGAPTDGGHPSAGLILVNGEFYGTTRAGGKIKPGGTVFKIDALGNEHLLHSFGVHKGDGENPAAPLVYYQGVLEGTTLHGGTLGQGTVFEITTGGTELVLHSFGAGADGAFPDAGLTELHGELYGTTLGGGVGQRGSGQCISLGRCGTIFKLDKFVAEHVVYRFTGDPDGANPEAPLTQAGGILYGTTYWGGASNYYGTIFRLAP
jgi:uncharacterized repeat protein (TIGR03803 family)